MSKNGLGLFFVLSLFIIYLFLEGEGGERRGEGSTSALAHRRHVITGEKRRSVLCLPNLAL